MKLLSMMKNLSLFTKICLVVFAVLTPQSLSTAPTECSQSDKQTFEEYVILDIEGTDINDKKTIKRIEKAIKDAYKCGKYRNIKKVDVLSAGTNSNSNSEELYTSESWLLYIEGETRLIDSGFLDVDYTERHKRVRRKRRRLGVGHQLYDQVSASSNSQTTTTTVVTSLPEINDSYYMEQSSRRLKKKKGRGDDDEEEDSIDEGCECLLPTASEFVVAINNNLHRKIRDTITILGIASTESNESKACDIPVEPFETMVLATVTGVPIDQITPDILDDIGESFIDTYNQLNILNSDICDPRYRLAQEATVTVQESLFATTSDFTFTIGRFEVDEFGLRHRRRLSRQEELSNTIESHQHRKLQTNLYYYLFNVSGGCRGCPGEGLYTNDAARRLDLVEGQRRLGRKKKQRMRKDNIFSEDSLNLFVESCTCPVDSEIRSLTADEFVAGWDLVGEFPEYVTSLMDVQDVVEVPCEDEFSPFATEIGITVQGIEGEVTDISIEQLEVAILETYNALQRELCDLQFRFVIEVNYLPDSDRRNLMSHGDDDNNNSSDHGHRNLLGGLNLFLLRFGVGGTCNGCPSDAELFNDSIRRTMREVSLPPNHQDDVSAPLLQFNRHLQGTTCLCNLDAEGDDRAPTIDEFEVALDTFIRTVGVDGIVGVMDVTTDLIRSAAPSAVPSAPPTAALSAAPSAVPSTVPSAVPSATPSTVPSTVPSATPSEEPTPSSFSIVADCNAAINVLGGGSVSPQFAIQIGNAQFDRTLDNVSTACPSDALAEVDTNAVWYTFSCTAENSCAALEVVSITCGQPGTLEIFQADCNALSDATCVGVFSCPDILQESVGILVEAPVNVNFFVVYRGILA